MKKLLLGVILLFSYSLYSQTVVYEDDFETTGTFIMSSTSTNQWVINDIYTAPILIPTVPSQPVGFSSPNGNYLHPISNIFAGSIDNANYELPSSEQMIAVMTSPIDLSNFENTEISFWRTGGSSGLKVIYSVNNGPWQDAFTAAGNPTSWQEETFMLTAVDGESNVRFGFEFDESAALDPAPNHYHSIDELTISATSLGGGADEITASVTDLDYCGGDQIDVTYDVTTGTINAGNTFTLELSDAAGSFASATSIGTLSSTNISGTISGTIPNGLSGTGYRVRVSSDDDPITGTDNGSDITINITPSVNAGMDQEICDGDNVTLTATNPDGATISWDNGVTDNTSFTPTSTQVYTVTASLNGCDATDNVEVVVNPTPNAPTITLNVNNDLEVTVGGGQTVEWYLDGNLITGQNGATITPTTNGDYTAVIVDGNCSSSASAVFVVDFVDLNYESKEFLTVSPNPFSDVISVNTSISEANDITIVDANGRKVFSGTINNGQINLSKIETGIYFLKVVGHEKTLKLIKK